MNDAQHNEIRDLLAVVALHSASEEEQRVVGDHLLTCDECRAEFDDHVQTATLLGAAPALPPESVWEQISTQIQEPPPPVKLVREQPPNRFARVMAVAAAFLLIAGGAFAANALRDDSSPTTEELAQEALNVEGARTIALTTPDGKEMADAVVLPDGRGYVFDSKMSAAPTDRTYQLWAVVGGQTLSAGVLGNDPKAATFTVLGDVKALAITEEQAGGVAQSNNPAIAVGKFA